MIYLDKIKKIKNFILRKSSEFNDQIIKKKYTDYQNHKINFIKKKSIIWHFATPKSASTYLMKYIDKSAMENNVDIRRIRALPDHNNRVQEISLDTLFFFIKNSNNKNFLISHVHSPLNNYLLKLFSSNHKIIIQYRDVIDTLLSLRDYMDLEAMNEIKEQKLFSSPWIEISAKNWVKLSSKEKNNLIIHYYLPWHLKFLHSWSNERLGAEVIYLNYENVINNIDNICSKIFNKEVKKKNIYLTKQSIRFNIGQDRQNTFNEDEILKIYNFISFYLSTMNTNIENIYDLKKFKKLNEN